jgi:hypothetical protein
VLTFTQLPYLEALEFSPENPEMLTTIGLLYLRMVRERVSEREREREREREPEMLTTIGLLCLRMLRERERERERERRERERPGDAHHHRPSLPPHAEREE